MKRPKNLRTQIAAATTANRSTLATQLHGKRADCGHFQSFQLGLVSLCMIMFKTRDDQICKAYLFPLPKCAGLWVCFSGPFLPFFSRGLTVFPSYPLRSLFKQNAMTAVTVCCLLSLLSPSSAGVHIDIFLLSVIYSSHTYYSAAPSSSSSSSADGHQPAGVRDEVCRVLGACQPSPYPGRDDRGRLVRAAAALPLSRFR